MLRHLRARLAIWRRAATALRSDGRTVLGIAARLRSKDGRPLGRYLHEKLPQSFVLSVGAEMVSDDVLNLELERDGIFWRVDLGDEIGRGLLVAGQYQRADVDAVLAWVRSHRDQPVVVDLGANVGTTTIPFAMAGYRVLAIEPVPTTFSMLSANVARNGVGDRVQCVRSAVGDSDGDVDMWTGFGSGQAEVAVPGRPPAISRWGDPGELVSVPAAPFDALLASAGVADAEVALVWSDVQGSETSVIETGAGLWERGVPLYAEIDPRFLELHGGLRRFLAAATSNFATFIPGEALLTTGEPRPIAELADFAASISFGRFTNALLLP